MHLWPVNVPHGHAEDVLEWVAHDLARLDDERGGGGSSSGPETSAVWLLWWGSFSFLLNFERKSPPPRAASAGRPDGRDPAKIACPYSDVQKSR